MGYALANREEYTEMMCGECGMIFYVPETWRHARQQSGKGFSCPNGHARIYKETIEQKLQQQLDEKERALQWEKSRADTLDKRLTQEKKKRQRLQKRVEAGVCPHCQRTFKQLAEHMKSKHPDHLEASKEQ